jgi:hypothetical protein
LNRFTALTVGLLIYLLSACAPPAIQVQDNILPTLISVRHAQDGSRDVILQGRYFGDATVGQAENSYVAFGTNAHGEGGVFVNANEWSASRIRVTVPEGVGNGFVVVVVQGVKSNVMTINMP